MKNSTILKKSTIVTLLFFLNISYLASQNLYELYETSFQPPTIVQQYVNSYLSGGVGLNPYDYTQLETYCIFTSPSGKSIKTFGFYYEGQNKTDNGLPSSPEILVPNGVKTWKIRFTPNEVGNWNYRIYVSDKVHKMTYVLNSVSFNCTKSATNNRNSKGFIRSANSRYLKYETGQPYYPIGNSCYSFSGNFWKPDQPEKGTNEMKAHMDEMSENKINFFRFEINHFGGVNLFGPDYSESKPEREMNTIYYDQFNQHDSWQLDNIINYANSKGIDLWLALFAHSTFGANGNYCKGNNDTGYTKIGYRYINPVNGDTIYIKADSCNNIPYSYCNWAKENPFNVYMEKKDHNIKSSLTGSCNSPYDFFDINNTEAIKVQRNLIKYIIARWGYATNILAFELMDEANIKAFNQKDEYPFYVPAPSNFDANYVTWNHNTYDYIKSIDHNNHFITSAFAGDAFIDLPNHDINNKVDFTQGHYYFDYTLVDPEERFSNNTNMNLDTFSDKPFIIGEFGYWPNEQDDPRVYELHNALWSTFFNGAFGSASFWEYDYLSKMGVLSEYKGISNFSKTLPQFSGNYNRHKIKTINGLRSYYLKSDNSLYGWIQAYDYRYNNMYEKGYIANFPNMKPSVSSIVNSLTLSVNKNAKYEVKWYNTNTGECVANDLQYKTVTNNQLNISMPSDLLNSDYADAGFSISCKPTTGWVEKQTCPTQWNSVMPNSKLAINDIGAIIYINSNRQICGFWKAQNDNNWSDAILSNPTDKKVLNGSNALLWSTINNCIYYVGDDQKIYKLFYSGGSWQCQLACSSQWNSVLATSALTECPDGSLLYVNVNKEICTLYISGSSMLDGIIPTTRKALNGKGLVNDPLSYATTYYVGSDYKIWKVFYTSNGWQNQQVCLTQSNIVRENSELVTGESSIFYVNNNNKLCILYKDGGIYYDAVINNTINIKSNSQLSHGEYATVYFIGTDNNIYKEFYSSAWNFTALNQSGFCQESANLNILTSTTYGIYYSGLSDNMVHDFAYNSILKSSEIVDNNSENVNSNIEDETKQYKVYPNPISKENGKLFIDCHSDNCNPYISIYNIYGQLVKNTRYISNGVDLSDLNPGMYMIMFDNGNSVENHKLIIKN